MREGTQTGRKGIALAVATATVTLLFAASSALAGAAFPTIITQATPSATLGQPITDSAFITGKPGAPPPAGSVSFRVFGPDDATCSLGFFVPGGPVTPDGPVVSSPFTPTRPGTYRWIADYSGDGYHLASSGACNDPNENSVVTAAAASPGTSTIPPPQMVVAPIATGQRAVAIKKCKKKFDKGTEKRKKCLRRARRLPV